MLRLALLLLLAPGLAAASSIGAEAARHLLNRIGFDAPIGQIETYARLSREHAVARTLAGVRTEARTPVPPELREWVPLRRLREMDEAERRRALRQLLERGVELRAWWVAEMLATDSPLTERMTLFWHNHFTSSLQKVRSPFLMQRQNALLRRHALGGFGELLYAASKDPAMLVYLDTARSRRARPNENFAREVMELFTLGEGRFSEQDVKEAARAFTGWSVDPDSGDFLFRPLAHDDGEKSVLGRNGRLRGEDVLEVLLERPETAQFVTARLWREFVSPAPRNEAEKRDLARVAERFRATGYSIRAALEALLLSESFWSTENRAALIKSPVELVVGTLRQLGIEVRDPLPFALLLRGLGQDLFAPPNVKGWTGGEAWINSQTLLARRQFLDRILRVDEARMTAQPAMETPMETLRPPARRFVRAIADLEFSGDEWLKRLEGRPAQLVLLAAGPRNDAAHAQGMDLLRALVADPVYQLR